MCESVLQEGAVVRTINVVAGEGVFFGKGDDKVAAFDPAEMTGREPCARERALLIDLGAERVPEGFTGQVPGCGRCGGGRGWLLGGWRLGWSGGWSRLCGRERHAGETRVNQPDDVADAARCKGLDGSNDSDFEVKLLVGGLFHPGIAVGKDVDEIEDAIVFEKSSLFLECVDRSGSELGGGPFGIDLIDEDIAKVRDQVSEEA